MLQLGHVFTFCVKVAHLFRFQAELALRQKRRDYLKWQLLNTTLKEVLVDAQVTRRDSGGDERKLQVCR